MCNSACATKLVFITVLAMQFFMVVSLQSKELLMTKDLVHILNQKTTEYNLKQSMTNVYLITSPAAKRLRSKFSFLNKPHEQNDGLDRLRRKFKFLFQSLDVPQHQLDLFEGVQQEYNEKYAARIARLSRYFLNPQIFSLVHNF